MNFGEECLLIYDKYANNTHSFTNKYTQNIDIKQLFDSKKYLYGMEAIYRYNEKFNKSQFVIPIDLDQETMSIYMFEFLNQDNIEIIITILSINTVQLGIYYNKHKAIPNKKFVVDCCLYHANYERIEQNNASDEQIIVNDLIKKVIVPSSDIMNPIIDNPEFMKGSLYDYQRRTIRWMLDTERNTKRIYYGTNYKYHIHVGDLIFDRITKSLISKEDQNYLDFSGGALIDEVGLGKTIQMLILSLLNRPKNLNYVENSETSNGVKMLRSKATLIICPNQLCNQWAREITKFISLTDLKIVLMFTKNHFDKVTYQEMLDADFVIISYNFISNSCFTDKFVSKISDQKSYCTSRFWDQSKVEELFKKMAEDLTANPTALFQTEPLFTLIHWHRIVIDEFHEPYVISKYKAVENMIPLLRSKYRWCVSGTPFDKGSLCFYKIFDFVTNYKNKLGYQIICMEDIKNHMSDNFFKRNTKKSVEDEFKLLDLKERIIWLKFTHTERMMYNAYLTDPNVSRFDEIIRQICCHPKIADEIKGVLNNCKTLDDIQNQMVLHYKKQFVSAQRSVDKCNRSIAKTKRRILVTEYKRQRRFLKQLGYRVEIDLPPFEYDEKEDELAENIDKDEDNSVNNEADNIDDDLNIDDDDDDDDDKPLFTITADNQAEIQRKIGKKLADNPSQTIKNYEDILNSQIQRLNAFINIFKGKKATYDFFNNMLERIKKVTDRAKEKYEKEMIKAKRLDNGDEEEEEEEEEEDESDDTCGICLNEISGEDVGVTKCGHMYCYECLKHTVNKLCKCPMCNIPLKMNEISMISYEKPVFTQQNSEILKNKLELINKVGTKLTNLIYYLNSIPDHVIIFSQWDSLLHKVGDVLTEHGITNVFCMGSVWARDKAIREYMGSDKIKVIMLSAKSAASGANLTKASKVILLDPISGDYEYRRNMEWQAIGRAYRMGQLKSVEVVRLIIKDTVEEEIYRANKLEDAKQKTQHNISETTDETIQLSDDKLIGISEAVQRAKELKEKKLELKKLAVKKNEATAKTKETSELAKPKPKGIVRATKTKLNA